MNRRRSSEAANEQPRSESWRSIGYHAARWACLVAVAVLTYTVFPVAGGTSVPLLGVGEVASREVIAPFEFAVPKSAAEIEQETAALAASVPSIYDYRPVQLDSVLAETDSLFAALGRARTRTELMAAAQTFGVRLTLEEGAYLLEGNRRAAFRRATRDLLARALRRGAAAPGTLEAERIREVVVRRDGIEGFARRDTLVTYERMLQSRFQDHPDPASSLGDQLLLKLVSRLFRPTLVPNAADTEARREELRQSVDSVKDVVRANEAILRANDPVTVAARERLMALRAELVRRGGGAGGSLRGAAGQVLVNALILAVFWSLLALYRPDIYSRLRRVVAVSVVFGMVIVGAAVNHAELAEVAELIPVPFAAMLLSILFGGRVAIVAAMALAVLVASQAVYGGVEAVFIATVGGSTAAISVRGIRHRNQLLVSVGMVVAAYLLSDVTMTVRSGAPLREAGVAGAWGVANAVVSTAIAFILLPLFERFTHVTTDLTLLELSDPNRPLLRRLATEAPGTYAHSIAMANLCESACNALGANGLLARVGCYYHDVGKLKKPHHFVENQAHGVNPHDKLKPGVSASIIRNHVRDGLALAEEYGLPEVVRAFIPEHHGTMEISYFLERARSRNGGEDIDPDEYRYPGPRPRSVETAVAMLADGVEAALRVLDDQTPERIRDAINHIVMHRVEAGQLDEAPITLAQLARIREEFIRVYAGARHGRIDYPASGGGIAADWQAATRA